MHFRTLKTDRLYVFVVVEILSRNFGIVFAYDMYCESENIVSGMKCVLIHK